MNSKGQNASGLKLSLQNLAQGQAFSSACWYSTSSMWMIGPAEAFGAGRKRQVRLHFASAASFRIWQDRPEAMGMAGIVPDASRMRNTASPSGSTLNWAWIATPCSTRIALAQHFLVVFADARSDECLDRDHPVRHRVARQQPALNVAANQVLDFGLVDRLAGARHYQR